MSSLRYYFDVTWHLIQRDFTLRYKGSVLGVLWVLVVPLMQLLTLVFVFKKVVPLNIDSYPAFVFTGLLPWSWFSSCISGSGTLFISNRDLVRRPNFPPLILITVNIFSNLLLFLTVLPLVFLTLLAYGHPLSWTLSLLPLLILIESVLIAGFSLMIAIWNVFYRDVQQIAGILVTLLFWITPVFYKEHAADQQYQYLFDLNPIAILIKNYREVLFYSHVPDWEPLLFSFIASIAVCGIGYFVYRRQLHHVIDAL